MRTVRYGGSRRRRKSFPMMILAIILAVITVGVFASLDMLDTTLAGNDNGAAGSSVDKIKDEKIYSAAALLADAETGDVLYAKNPGEKMYPASLTKMMTVLTSINHRKSLDEKVSLDGGMISSLKEDNASLAGYTAGEVTTVEDLFYACLLPSGAEAALGLSEAVSQSEAGLIKLMNDKAAKLDMSETHFTNVTGLHDDNQYTTAKDMAILLRNALKNPIFREVFTSKSHSIKTNKREFTVSSTFFDDYAGGKRGYTVMGAKTGTTSDAGHCLASLVKKDGREYILVTLNATIEESNRPLSFDDLDYVFSSI